MRGCPQYRVWGLHGLWSSRAQLLGSPMKLYKARASVFELIQVCTYNVRELRTE